MIEEVDPAKAPQSISPFTIQINKDIYIYISYPPIVGDLFEEVSIFAPGGSDYIS